MIARAVLLVLLTLGACTPAPDAWPCDWLNHSGVCETYAPLSPELLHAIDSMKASAPSGDIIL